MTALQFPGGVAVVDTERVWRELQRWLEQDGSRRCSVYRDSQGYCCRLTWDNATKADSGGCSARSGLGIADAVANALQAAEMAARVAEQDALMDRAST